MNVTFKFPSSAQSHEQNLKKSIGTCVYDLSSGK